MIPMKDEEIEVAVVKCFNPASNKATLALTLPKTVREYLGVKSGQLFRVSVDRRQNKVSYKPLPNLQKTAHKEAKTGTNSGGNEC
jgi:hypothetical protein